jgi:hypothetical protein
MQRELLDRQTWTTRADLGSAIFKWIEACYNPRRRQDTLGRLTRSSSRQCTKPPTRPDTTYRPSQLKSGQTRPAQPLPGGRLIRSPGPVHDSAPPLSPMKKSTGTTPTPRSANWIVQSAAVPLSSGRTAPRE